MKEDPQLIPHLFRTEYSRITAVLGKLLGFGQIGIAEDLASDTFLAAAETWPYKGIPDNPAAWLHTVAKNKAANYFKHHKIFTQKVTAGLARGPGSSEQPEVDLSEKNITDSQLQMLFAICHPAISAEAQITLALRILCGFGMDEIADAFMSNTETIAKRIFRAKEKLRREKVAIVFPGKEEIDNRLETVLRTLYLLFSEGYYSQSTDAVIRKDLCLEAMKLNHLLLQNDATNTQTSNALMALMCFHTSRLDARLDHQGDLVQYQDQDESLWDRELMEKGNFYLQKAAAWKKTSKYFLEAAIAYWHTIKEDSPEKWESILQLYNGLLQLEYTPLAALNRTYALSKARSKKEAIIEAEKLQLQDNLFYQLLLADLYDTLDKNRMRYHLEKAHTLAKTLPEKKLIEKKLSAITS